MRKKERTKKLKEGGRNGGNKTLEIHGKKHYEEIGKKGAEKRWKKEIVTEIEKDLDIEESAL